MSQISASSFKRSLEVPKGPKVDWEELRDEALSRLYEDVERELVDDELVELLELLNRSPNVYTTSSCAGRITLGCNDTSWEDKKSTRLPFKSHKPVSVNDVLSVIEKIDCRWMWLKVSYPLLDIAVKNIDDGLKLVEVARKAGFKYSGIQPSRGQKYHVLIRGNDNVQVPLRKEIDVEELAKIISLMNRILLDGKVKLARLVSMLEEEGFIDGLEELLF